MNWFERHLNWTVVLSWVAQYPLAFVLGTLVTLFLYSVSPNMAEETVAGVAAVIAVIGDLTALFLVGAWALKKKARSLWNLLLLILPFGFIIFLSLENRSIESPVYYTCSCCGAQYDTEWGKTYGAASRCCTDLPQEEQEELWNNRLNINTPLLDCKHRL